MVFDWSVFTSVFVAGVGIAVFGWLMVRSIDNACDVSKLEKARKLIEEYRREVVKLRAEIYELKVKINALQADVDTLHDALIKQLRKPPRRGD